jgi:hypothetical protein
MAIPLDWSEANHSPFNDTSLERAFNDLNFYDRSEYEQRVDCDPPAKRRKIAQIEDCLSKVLSEVFLVLDCEATVELEGLKSLFK